MKLYNYLLKLDDLAFIRQGCDNIRLYRVGEIIRTIYSELKQHKSIGQIEDETKTHQTYSNWILNKTGIAVQDLYSLCKYWKETCSKSEQAFEEMWRLCFDNSNYFGTMNGKLVTLPKVMDYRLAYLLGVMFGDGHLADPNKSYDELTSYNSEIRITDQHKETFNFLQKLFKDLFNYTPKIYSEYSKIERKFYRFVIKSKPLHRFFMVVCGMPVGDKRGKLKIPDIIGNASLELQKWFISGFFDADGCITFNKCGQPNLVITQYGDRILKQIIEICAGFNVRWLGPYNYNYKYQISTICINRKQGVKRFLKEVPSLNPHKINMRNKAWKILKK